MLGLWVTMSGPAGAGKSTLADALARRLADDHPVDRFGEEELFTRPQFAVVADGFRGPDHPRRTEFEGAYTNWLRDLPERTVAIMDWCPSGMAGDLPWGLASRPGYVDHLRRVRELAAGRVLQLRLRVPADVAVGRAAAERGETWLDRYDTIARADGHDHPARLRRIADHAARHDVTTERENEAAAAAGWPVRTLDASGPAAEVCAAALAMVLDRLRSQRDAAPTPPS